MPPAGPGGRPIRRSPRCCGSVRTTKGGGHGDPQQAQRGGRLDRGQGGETRGEAQGAGGRPECADRRRRSRSARRSQRRAPLLAPQARRRGVSHGPFRHAIAELVPYEPGKPVEEVQRELGLERVVKLASNEGPFPPFPAALEALERNVHELNRYPDGGAYALRARLAELHGVKFEEVAVGAGADGVIDCLSQAVLEEGDEIVCGWPSFPSYVIDAVKLGATPVRVPLADHRYDLAALLDAVTPPTK